MSTYKDVKLAFVEYKFRLYQLNLSYWKAFGSAAIMKRIEMFLARDRNSSAISAGWGASQILPRMFLQICRKAVSCRFCVCSQGNKPQWKLPFGSFLWFFHVVPFSLIGCILYTRHFFPAVLGSRIQSLGPAATRRVQRTSPGSEVFYFLFFPKHSRDADVSREWYT